MDKLRQAAWTAIHKINRSTGFDEESDELLMEAASVLREALGHSGEANEMVIDWEAIDKEQVRRYKEKFGDFEQAKQEPVAKTALKNCIYFDSIDFNQTPPYLRYDTGDSTPKENWNIYCDIQEDLRKNGYELTDSDVDHDTVCGDVTPIKAHVRTKDLTDDEVEALFWKWKSATEYPVPLFEFRDIARFVIAADREKNK